MVRRVMVVLALLAFAVTVLGGLLTGNRSEFILSRALWAMALFGLLGVCLGWCAQQVVHQYRRKQQSEVFGPDDDTPRQTTSGEDSLIGSTARPIEN